ncbi:aldo/keto reductase [Lentilitoribacter sp. Alg239-R112]|uniref:aldo/keto reductase n=1 Tax=Lentilitoribacter sp. Alg239-R112 TaxID=2305987 RepID=UPI0013A68C05|nr:aldo/keto reductase [Lentilitoribacter sp. Alg239-R112]
MQQRRLGPNGPMVGAVGLGCMSFAGFYGACDIKTAHDTLAKAHELGMTHLDTAKIYGDGVSEDIIGKFLKENPELKYTIATKGGINTTPPRAFDNSPEYLSDCLEGSLKRLGVDYVDLYYIHRRDQTRPIEDVMETLVKFIDQGKIGAIGFSEISPSSLERASAIYPVAAVQSEYSIWTRMPELGVIQACKRLGTTFVPFSPLGRGILTDDGANMKAESFSKTDFRHPNPRFIEPNLAANQAKISTYRSYAKDKGVSSAGLTIAWILAQNDISIPIPGTRTVNHLEQCAEGADINLSQTELDEIEAILPVGFAHGYRYSEPQRVGPEDYC